MQTAKVPAQVRYLSAVPVVATDDVSATAAYCVDVLGFTSDWVWGDPPEWAGVKHGEVEIYICRDPAMAPAIAGQPQGHDIFVWVDDADEAYRGHRSRDAEIIATIEDKPWGVRQYTVGGPHGYRFKFAALLERQA